MEPYIEKVYDSYLLIEKNGLVCQNGDVIKDGNIVEFSYNHKVDSRFCWNPMRLRSGPRPNIKQHVMYGGLSIILLLLK